MSAITRLAGESFPDHVGELAGLLAEAVAGGASIGFLTPFEPDAAAGWWQAKAPAVADGTLTVWVSRDARGLDGTVSLVREGKDNGRHRAEIVKLMVRADARGRGLARALLATAEEAAARAGATLLLLDTETGSGAECLYLAEGWTRYGVVPGYAASPDGTPQACSFFYKELPQMSWK